ncbi:MAG: flagellar hook-length control protein FliK [Undibacterium sp.]|nr:flagellar hook-length control protein FliK [Undibacterium sp.]
MLPRVDTNIRPIASIEAPSAVASIGVTKQEVAHRLDQLVIGKQIQGEILSRLNDGTFFVRLAGATARMALPQNSKAGESIPLTLISLTPRPTFLLDAGQGNTTTTATFSRQDLIKNFLQDPKTTQTVLLDKTLPNDASTSYVLETEQARTTSILHEKLTLDNATTNIAEQYESSANSTPTNLSDTGKLINKILLQAQQEGATNVLLGKTPLLQSAEELKHPDKIANHLQQTIASSGIFYESHVANWAEGKLTRADLMREPQAQMGNTAINNAISNSVIGDDYSNLAKIIHLQLDVLEQQRITWQGALLPGLPLKWEILRDNQHAQENSAEQEVNWQSIVRFELPQLGVVAATISLHKGQLQLFLRSDTEETINLLKEYSSDLAEALKQCGAPLAFFNAKHDERA